MALRNVLILRKPRSGCLEGRTALIQFFHSLVRGPRLAPPRRFVRSQRPFPRVKLSFRWSNCQPELRKAGNPRLGSASREKRVTAGAPLDSSEEAPRSR